MTKKKVIRKFDGKFDGKMAKFDHRFLKKSGNSGKLDKKGAYVFLGFGVRGPRMS